MASGSSRSIACTSRAVLPVPTGMWERPIRSNDGERRPGHERPGVVGGDDPLAGPHARGRVAPRRAGDPVVEIARGQRDVARRRRWCRSSSRSGRSRRRPRRGASPNGLSRVRVARSSSFSVSGSCAISASPPPVSAPGELLAVERRALEEVGELRPVARVVDGELLRPGRAPRPQARASGSYRPPLPPLRRARTRAAAPAPPRGARAGRRAGEDRHRLDGRTREAEVEQHRRDRHRDVHRQRLPRLLGDRLANARASATCGPLTPRASASSRIRSARGSSGLCTGWPKPGTLPPAARSSRATSPARAGRDRAGEQPRALLRRPEQRPARRRGSRRRPPLQRPRSAASVIRAATFVGISPCSAIATSSRSRKKRWSSVGSLPVSRRWKYSVKLAGPSGRR